MKHKGRIGGLFLVSMLAFASISVSYASVTGGIVVQGVTRTVATGLNVEAVTGMDVYKVWGVSENLPGYWKGDIDWDEANEILIISGVIGEIPDETDVMAWAQDGNAMHVSHASAEVEVELEKNNYYVNLTYENVFPGVNHTAGFIFGYNEVPVEIEIEFMNKTGYDFTEYLSYEVSNVKKENDQWVANDDASNYRLVEITLLLDQQNDLQGKYGEFTAGKIYVNQEG